MLSGCHILVVDDSRLMREEVKRVLVAENASVIEARDPYEAVAAIRIQIPDAILLDLEMPRMDGLTFLQKLMLQHPMPVIVCSAAAMENPRLAFQALENGALEVISKPTASPAFQREAWARTLVEALARAVDTPQSRLRSVAGRTGLTRPCFPVAPVVAAKPRGRLSDFVIAIGASTGGTRALADLLVEFTPETPGTVVVQHMPRAFTGPFAQHLDRLCRVSVKEAETGDELRDGRVLIAAGGRQMEVVRSGLAYSVVLRDAPPVNRHCPSVDVMFDSVAIAAGRRSASALLTGMGDDGARGLLKLREAGSHTIAQDEASCVVFGMPREAIRRGAAIDTLPLNQIAAALVHAAERKNRISI